MGGALLMIGMMVAAQVDDVPPPPPVVDDLEEPETPAAGGDEGRGEVETPADTSTPADDADKASADPRKRTAEERAVIQPGSVASLYGLMTIPALVGSCITGLSPCFVLLGAQAFFLTCGTACGMMGFFPIVQGVMGWLISDALLGIEADLMWIMVGAYGACVVVMPLALIVGLGLGLLGIVEVGNLQNGLGWSYAPFLPQPDPTSLLVGSAIVPVGVMVMGAMAQTVGPTAAAVLTAQEPETQATDESPLAPRRRQVMRF